MKTLSHSIMLLLLVVVAAGCYEDAPVSEQMTPSATVADYVATITDDVIGPLTKAASTLSVEDAIRLTALSNKALMSSADDGEHASALQRQLSESIDRLMSVDVRQRLRELVASMFADHPYLKSLTQEELAAEIGGIVGTTAGFSSLGKAYDSCGPNCAAAAAASVIVIEAAFVGAAFGCAATTVGYGLCMGVALLAKNAALVVAGTTLASCMSSCPA